jgi:hypothetical protein
MTLQDWLKASALVAHKTSPQEVRGLMAVAARDLADAQVEGLSRDTCSSLAYNAVLQSALAALTAAGYRIARGVSHHHYAMQSLAYTVGCEAGIVSKLDKFRKKRNISDYEQAGTVSDQEADEMLRTARELRAKVEDWLRREHADLIGA